MHDFRYVGKKLFCEGVAVETLAKKFGTPLYVYSQRTLTNHFQKLDQALAPLDHLVCFAMKSNSNLAVLRTLADLGGGFDIVSGGELQRVIAAGGDPRQCIFAGVGKTGAEIEFALRQNIYAFNVESEPELQRINRIAARLKKIAPVAVRVNPNVEAHTHAKITTGTYENKFGIAFEQVEGVYARAAKLKNLRLRGLQMHIGSQLTTVTPFEQAVRKVLPLVAKLKAKHGLEFFSIGGGLGIVYDPALASGTAAWWQSAAAKNVLTPAKYAARLVPLLKPLGMKILLEPGRFISGNAGILVTRVEYVKRTGKKNFLIVDAAMNDLIRPAFYDAYHEIVPADPQRRGADFIRRRRADLRIRRLFLQGPSAAESWARAIASRLLSAGAYGLVMGSNYNARPLAAEVLVNGKKFAAVRERQAGQRNLGGRKNRPVAEVSDLLRHLPARDAELVEQFQFAPQLRAGNFAAQKLAVFGDGALDCLRRFVEKFHAEIAARRAPSIFATYSAPVCACELNTVLRQPASALSGCSAPTRSRSFTSCLSHGRPQLRVIRAAGEKRAEHAMLHVKHRHVLVDRDLEPFRRRGLQQRLELRKIQIVDWPSRAPGRNGF